MRAILEIEHASFARSAYPESLFRLYAADRRTLFLVAEAIPNQVAEVAGNQGARIRHKVGYIIAREDRWGAEIVSLAVHPDSRHHGVGGALLAAAVKRMMRRKPHSIRLMVHADNSTAVAFYRHHGFRSRGRVPDYYEDGATGIRMRLRLAPNSK